MGYRKRHRSIAFRVTEEEWKQFDELAKIYRMPKGTILRGLIEGFVYQPCPVDEAIEYIKQLRHIGNNINQIAYVAQKTGNIDTPMLKDQYRQQLEIIAATKRSPSTPVTFDIRKVLGNDLRNEE